MKYKLDFSLLKPISAHTSDVLCLAYLGSGRIASGSQDKSVRIWDGNISKSDGLVHVLILT